MIRQLTDIKNLTKPDLFVIALYNLRGNSNSLLVHVTNIEIKNMTNIMTFINKVSELVHSVAKPDAGWSQLR